MAPSVKFQAAHQAASHTSAEHLGEDEKKNTASKVQRKSLNSRPSGQAIIARVYQ